MGENVVAAYLSATYSREVSHDAAVDMGLSPRPGNPQDILIFASFWSGTFGTYPGIGSGNEAAEAIHSAWQQHLAELGAVGASSQSCKSCSACTTDGLLHMIGHRRDPSRHFLTS